MKRNFLPILSTEMITIYEVAIKSAAPAWSDPANYCFVYLSFCSSMVVKIWRSIYCMLVPQIPFIPYPLRYCMWIIDSQSMLASKTNLWFVIAMELLNILLYRLEQKHLRNNGLCSNKIPLLACTEPCVIHPFFFTKKSNNINMIGFFIMALILVWSKLFSTYPELKAFFFTSTYSVADTPQSYTIFCFYRAMLPLWSWR